MTFSLLLERSDVIAVDKPAGVASIDHARGEPSPLVAWLRENFPEVCALGEGPRPAGQVHRIDTATSGVLLVARTAAAHEALRAAFSQTGVVHKEYRALLHGEVAEPLTLEWPIGMRGRSNARVKVVSAPGKAKGLRGIRPARTIVTPVKTGAFVTEADVVIETGVRHQIRAHADAAGHAVVGDPLYGEQPPLPGECETRLYLHAGALAVRGVSGFEDFRVESPVPASFGAAFEALERA